jgi:transcriptional regulator with XRE-family HTH domain
MEAAWFAGRLKELREQAGLTQQELADRAGLNRFGVAKLEQGVTKPYWDTVVALCKALRVSADAFLQPPAVTSEAKPGRPPKSKQDTGEPGSKRPRGRPRSRG